MEMNRSDPFSYLHRTGIMSSGIAKGVTKPKVTTVGMAMKRPPEQAPRTPQGKKEGWSTKGDVKSTAKKGSSFVDEANTKGTNGDGWTGKKNTPSRVGPETGPSQGFETKGDSKARAAGKKGVEAQSPKVEKGKGLAKRANIEGNESKKYNALEKKSLRSLKGGGTEKELRAGHNQTSPVGGISRTTQRGDRGPGMSLATRPSGAGTSPVPGRSGGGGYRARRPPVSSGGY